MISKKQTENSRHCGLRPTPPKLYGGKRTLLYVLPLSITLPFFIFTKLTFSPKLSSRHALLKPTAHFLHTALPLPHPPAFETNLLNPAPIPISTGPTRDPPVKSDLPPLYFVSFRHNTLCFLLFFSLRLADIRTAAPVAKDPDAASG